MQADSCNEFLQNTVMRHADYRHSYDSCFEIQSQIQFKILTCLVCFICPTLRLKLTDKNKLTKIGL